MILKHHDDCDNRVLVMVRREMLFPVFFVLFYVVTCCRCSPFWGIPLHVAAPISTKDDLYKI